MMHKLVTASNIVSDLGTSASEQNARPVASHGPRSESKSAVSSLLDSVPLIVEATTSLLSNPQIRYPKQATWVENPTAYPTIPPVHPAQARHFASHFLSGNTAGLDSIETQMRRGKVIKYLRCQIVSLDWRDEPSYPAALTRVSLSANPIYSLHQACLRKYVIAEDLVPAKHTIAACPDQGRRMQSSYVVRATRKAEFKNVTGNLSGLLISVLFSSATPHDDLILFFMHGQTGTWFGLPFAPNGGDLVVDFPEKIFWAPKLAGDANDSLSVSSDSPLTFASNFSEQALVADRLALSTAAPTSENVCVHCGINPMPAVGKCTACYEPVCSRCSNFRCERIP